MKRFGDLNHIVRGAQRRLALAEKGTSVLVEFDLRYRLCNRYCKTGTKSLCLRHQVNDPVPKALFSIG